MSYRCRPIRCVDGLHGGAVVSAPAVVVLVVTFTPSRDFSAGHRSVALAGVHLTVSALLAGDTPVPVAPVGDDPAFREERHSRLDGVGVPFRGSREAGGACASVLHGRQHCCGVLDVVCIDVLVVDPDFSAFPDGCARRRREPGVGLPAVGALSGQCLGSCGLQEQLQVVPPSFVSHVRWSLFGHPLPFRKRVLGTPCLGLGLPCGGHDHHRRQSSVPVPCLDLVDVMLHREWFIPAGAGPLSSVCLAETRFSVYPRVRGAVW